MVNRIDLRLSEIEMHQISAPVRAADFTEDPTEHFASIAWSVVCEPGDGFAGQLISTFGAAQALDFELNRISAQEYVSKFAEVGSDWLEMQLFGKFERTLADSRQRWAPRLTLSGVVDSVQKVSSLGGWFIGRQSECWPTGFSDLGRHCPPGVWGLGLTRALSGPAVSIVGSRMATAYGEECVGELVGPLTERGYTIVSGGAYGIDAMAHRAALALDSPTVAVMAGGLDKLYPSGNLELFKSISRAGCLISEMPPGAEPTKWRFLQRNRLIAAIGRATVVVEANPRSGAVSTANRAIELGRPVGAVPGPIRSAGSDGCHRLIRDLLATLVTGADDVLELIGATAGNAEQELEGLGALETRVYDVIGFRSASLDVICSEGGLTRTEAQIGVAGLSLLGLIDQDSNRWRRKH
jgi:DNA processing protein